MPAPRKNAPRTSDLAFIEVSHAGETFRIALKRISTARRFTLRVRAATRDVVLTMPPRGSIIGARNFVERHAAWIGVRLQRLPAPMPFGGRRDRADPRRQSPHCRASASARHGLDRGRAKSEKRQEPADAVRDRRAGACRAARAGFSDARGQTRHRGGRRAPCRQARGHAARGSPCATRQAAGVRAHRPARSISPGG